MDVRGRFRRHATLLALLATCVGAAPEAIVHVGPHKTGSTTIQIALLKSGPLRDSLIKRDGFHVPLKIPGRFGGHKTHANIADALLSSNATSHPAWPHFLAHASSAARAGRRLFISSENLSVIGNKGNLELFIAALTRLGFRVRVVMVHRRLYLKLPSVHSELFMADSRPVISTHAFVPFVDWVARADSHVRARFGQTVALRDQFARLGTLVGVMNLHALPATNRALLSHFVCVQMRARASCALIRSDQLRLGGNKNVRPRSHAPLYDLVYGAARAANVSRIDQAVALDAVWAALNRNPELGTQISLRCLQPAKLNALWAATEEEERAMQGALSGAQVAELQRLFARAATSTLCSANVSATMAIPEWAAVLNRAVTRSQL